MKTSVSYNQIVNELVNIFNSEARKNEYYNTTGGTLRDGVCGWCGVMAPLSKSAFIEDFGLATVEKAEEEARERLNANKNDFRKTNYFAHEAEATANEATNTVAAGSFVWACFSGLKNDGEGLRGFVHQCTYPEEEFKDLDRKHKTLVKIEKVFTVKSSELLTIDTDNLVATNKAADKNNYFPGGAGNDDPDYMDLFDEYATYYTCAAAVVDELGRWFIIDSQGYDFARYIGAPINWREMFADIKAEEERKHAERIEAERLEAEREAAERLAVYNARCAKWESIMTDLRPLKKAAEEADKLHGWRSKEAKAADRKLKSGIRANVLAMVHAVYPGLRCSLRVNNGWGSAYELTYQDGPTLKEFNENTDLDLFENIAYTFNGYDDSTGFAYPEFADFSEKYFTVQYGGINVDREQSEENRAQLEEIILKAVPEIDNIHPLTTKEYNAIANALGVDVDDIINKSEYWNKTAKGIAYGVFGLMSFAKANETTEATANEPTAAPTESNEDDKPADGLALVEIVGGVAVVGDARTTYRNRKEIKAHGAKWNRDAQQWQATEAEAVASLRRWFGVGNPEQPTPDDDPTPTKRNEESAAEATEATETTATDNNTTESEKSAQNEEKPQNVANNKNYPEWLKVGVSFCLIDWITGKPTKIIYKCTAIDEINETFVISTDTHGSREYKLNSFYWSQFAPVEPTPTTAKEEPQSEEKAVNSTLYDNEKLTVSTETETVKTFSPHDMVSYKGGVFELLGMRSDGTEATIKAKGGSRLCVPVAELEASTERKCRLPEWMKRGQAITNGKFTLIIASVGNSNINVINDSPLQITAALLKYEPVEATQAPEWLKPGAKVTIKNDHTPADVLAVDGCAVAVHQDFGEGCTYDHDVKIEDLKPYYSACEKSPIPEKQETERSFNVGDSVILAADTLGGSRTEAVRGVVKSFKWSEKVRCYMYCIIDQNRREYWDIESNIFPLKQAWKTRYTPQDFEKLACTCEISEQDNDIMGKRFESICDDPTMETIKVFVSEYVGDKCALVYILDKMEGCVKANVLPIDWLRQTLKGTNVFCESEIHFVSCA